MYTLVKTQDILSKHIIYLASLNRYTFLYMLKEVCLLKLAAKWA